MEALQTVARFKRWLMARWHSPQQGVSPLGPFESFGAAAEEIQVPGAVNELPQLLRRLPHGEIHNDERIG